MLSNAGFDVSAWNGHRASIEPTTYGKQRSHLSVLPVTFGDGMLAEDFKRTIRGAALMTSKGLNRQGLTLVIATPYREGSILAIARTASERGQLESLYTTLYPAKLKRVTTFLPLQQPRNRLGRELDRRIFPGIPGERVISLSSMPELLHIAARRLLPARPTASVLMYAAKRSFDRRVARHLRQDIRRWDAVIAMYASAGETLRLARECGRLSVLNFVNSHPRHRNHLLMTSTRLREGHHELVPPDVADAVERELESADLILVPSRYVARQLEELGVPTEKVALEPYGVDLEAFYPPNERWSYPHANLRKFRCLYVGQISYRKGVSVLVEVARLLQNKPYEFTLIGPMVSPDVLRNLPGNCRWLGSTMHMGVAEVMRQSDIFILPSIDDAYPLVTLEAMASGLPVIVSDHAGTSELISSGVDGLVVEAGNVRALADAIELLAEDADLRVAMGQAARRTVEHGHSWADYGRRILDLLAKRVWGRS